MAEERERAGGLHQGTKMRREDPARNRVPMSGNDKRTLPAPRRTQHRAEDGGRNRADSAGCYEARPIHGARKSGAGRILGTLEGLPPDAGGVGMRIITDRAWLANGGGNRGYPVGL
jgi:hypothetical protein